MKDTIYNIYGKEKEAICESLLVAEIESKEEAEKIAKYIKENHKEIKNIRIARFDLPTAEEIKKGFIDAINI